jgi:uncharacterized membrane protein
MNNLTPYDKKRITEAIEKAERTTSAQIAWKVDNRSSSYLDAGWIWSFITVLIGLVAQIALTTVNGWGTSATLSLTEVVVCAGAGLLIAKIPTCRRLVISDKRMARQVKERAQAYFFTGGVHLTSQHNGVLIYVSRFERMAILVSDVAADITGYPSSWYFAHDYTGPTWKDKAAFVGALEFYIDSLGDYLSKKYPRPAGSASTNEVTDEELPDDDDTN